MQAVPLGCCLEGNSVPEKGDGLGALGNHLHPHRGCSAHTASAAPLHDSPANVPHSWPGGWCQSRCQEMRLRIGIKAPHHVCSRAWLAASAEQSGVDRATEAETPARAAVTVQHEDESCWHRRRGQSSSGHC